MDATQQANVSAKYGTRDPCSLIRFSRTISTVSSFLLFTAIDLLALSDLDVIRYQVDREVEGANSLRVHDIIH